jgi:hypothetical protein
MAKPRSFALIQPEQKTILFFKYELYTSEIYKYDHSKL